MAMLEPRLCILDETDSGLDIDALRMVADGVNALRSPDRAMIVITHYQRLLDYIVPDVVHVLSKGRVDEDRRQGAGARARGARLRRIPRRGGLRSAMNAEDPPDPHRRRARLARCLRAAQGPLPGNGAVAAARTAAFRTLRGRGPAASPRRGVEVHRPARPDARGQAAGEPARRHCESARKDAGQLLAGVDAGGSCSSTACSCRSSPTSRNLEDGSDHALAGRGAGGRRSGGDERLGKVVPVDDDIAVALNTAFMGDGAVIRVAAGAQDRASDASVVRRGRRSRRGDVHALAGRGRARPPA